jgi:uncharacterized protein
MTCWGGFFLVKRSHSSVISHSLRKVKSLGLLLNKNDIDWWICDLYGSDEEGTAHPEGKLQDYSSDFGHSVLSRLGGCVALYLARGERYFVSLLQWSVKKAKRARSLSPPSGAPRRIGAVVDEERFGSKLDISMKKIELSVNQPEENAPPRRRGAAVFLFLIVTSMILSLFVVRQGNSGFVMAAVTIIFRNLGLVGLILFSLWRNGENVESIGWSFRRAGREVALGAALFIPFVFGATLLEQGLLRIGLSRPATPLPSFLAARGVAEFLLAAVLVAVVAVTEETIFRGYLLLRFKTLLRSPALAVFLSSVIFSLGHGYEGSVGLVTAGVLGAVFAIIYLWRRSLVAPIVMHFLQNFLGIVLLPLLGMK